MNFRFNVSIALFYELYNFFRDQLNKDITNKLLQKNIINTMKLMIPFTPHLAYESLELLKCKNVDKWPDIDKINVSEEIKLAIQVNGKTRDIINIIKDTEESDLKKIIFEQSKAKKYLENQKIIKTIFVKNKIINYIIKK